MNPPAARAAILIVELMVFFIVTAFTSYFISHASTIRPAPGEALPPHFPVIAYEGDRDRPAASGYRVVTWSEWELLAQRRPAASLLLPERVATVKIGETGEASFIASEPAAGKQSVTLKWRTGGGEQEAHYVAEARAIEPRLLRTLGSQTLLMGAAAGFVAGLFAGRAMRRRWLAVPGRWAPP